MFCWASRKTFSRSVLNGRAKCSAHTIAHIIQESVWYSHRLNDCTGSSWAQIGCIHQISWWVSFNCTGRFITYWLPFCWTKRSQLQRFPCYTSSSSSSGGSKNSAVNFWCRETIESNCEHCRVQGYFVLIFEPLKSVSLFTRGWFRLWKMIALFFNFHYYYYFMGNLFLYCTCLGEAIVFLDYGRIICHFIGRWWKTMNRIQWSHSRFGQIFLFSFQRKSSVWWNQKWSSLTSSVRVQNRIYRKIDFSFIENLFESH